MTQQRFVTRSGSQLLLDGKQFRFAGPNIYWLGLDENVDGVDYPTTFRVDNVLNTALEMGASVVRSHTLAASHGCPEAIEPELGVFNEQALKKVDYAIQAAGARGLKLIIPLVDNWNYYHGGRQSFTRWRGLEDANAFYTDRQVIGDFKEHIQTIINRVNTYTGVAYKDDAAILAWEIGNELNDAPAAWVQEIAGFIKGQDGNHLVAFGKQFQLDEDKLDIAELDIIDVHYYPPVASSLVADAEKAAQKGKVFIAGEFGWSQGDLNEFLDAAEAHPSVAGTLFWSLFGHHDRGGYVQHFDGFALHYPGNAQNEELMSRILRLRQHAFAMRGESVPEAGMLDKPIIIGAEGKIVFRGVAGAAYYTVERSSEGEAGPWSIVYEKRPVDHEEGWHDPVRIHTQEAWYRVKGISLSGQSGAYSDCYHSLPFSVLSIKMQA